MKLKKGVILLSGGLDSATCAAIAIDSGFELSALTFDYGQRHAIELKSAVKAASFFRIKDHHFVKIDAQVFRSSLLMGSSDQVPKLRDMDNSDIPTTYVPARNIIFLSYAAGYAESIGAGDIFIGANSVDYSGYPDCRGEFFEAFERAVNLGTKTGVSGSPIKINTPLLTMKKSDIIKTGTKLGVDYSVTHSCYDPSDDGTACGVCDSCILRLAAFAEAGLADPVRYRGR